MLEVGCWLKNETIHFLSSIPAEAEFYEWDYLKRNSSVKFLV